MATFKVATGLVVCALLGAARADGPSGAARGIDVSEWQGTIDWPAVKSSGISFAMTRVSDGVSHPDPTFATNWRGMKEAGLVRGAYQYFHPGGDAAAQAALFTSTLGALGPGDMPPVMDLETTDGAGSATIAANVQRWVDIVHEKTGMTPLIYCSPGFWNALGIAPPAGAELWVATWGSSPAQANGFGDYRFWQNADNGSVPGVNGAVDTDVFHGDEAALREWVASRQPGPPPPPPPEKVSARIASPDDVGRLADTLADPKRKSGEKGKVSELSIDVGSIAATSTLSVVERAVKQLKTQFGGTPLGDLLAADLDKEAAAARTQREEASLDAVASAVKARLAERGLDPKDVFTPDAKIVVTGASAPDTTKFDAALAAELPPSGRLLDETRPESVGLLPALQARLRQR